MNYTLVLFCALFTFFLLNAIYALITRRNFLGYKSSPISFPFLFSSFLMLPGVYLISFADYPSWRIDSIGHNLKLVVGIWYVISLFLFFFVISFLQLLLNNREVYKSYEVKVDVSDSMLRFFYLVFTISVIGVILKYYLMGNVPLLMLLAGDLKGAALARAEYQLNPSSYKLPFLSDIFTFLSGYQFLYLWLLRIRSNYKIPNVLLALSFFIVILSFTADIQKGPIVVFSLFCAYLSYSYTGRKSLFIKLSLSSLMLIFLMYYLVYGKLDLIVIANQIIDRAFLGQPQGLYHIINSITPDSKYIFSGMPFSSRFGLDVFYADQEIVSKIYPKYLQSHIVNSNSYFLAEAWSMFGGWGLLLSPIIVAIVVSMYMYVLDKAVKFNAIVFLPYLFYMLYNLPFHTSFSYFLYSRHFIQSAILSFITLVFIIKLSKIKF
ncbi:hypothetical protein [Paraferrimonas sp. SM1919]|uniref:hypothetical protein n=1 Tax=Paraferrimonas sp. SM1919 TaxID=2662263 RepID=UPI0013D53D62|nr:hypothetical protein [Paraferrimonas sp. SM1919]